MYNNKSHTGLDLGIVCMYILNKHRNEHIFKRDTIAEGRSPRRACTLTISIPRIYALQYSPC